MECALISIKDKNRLKTVCYPLWPPRFVITKRLRIVQAIDTLREIFITHPDASLGALKGQNWVPKTRFSSKNATADNWTDCTQMRDSTSSLQKWRAFWKLGAVFVEYSTISRIPVSERKLATHGISTTPTSRQLWVSMLPLLAKNAFHAEQKLFCLAFFLQWWLLLPNFERPPVNTRAPALLGETALQVAETVCKPKCSRTDTHARPKAHEWTDAQGPPPSPENPRPALVEKWPQIRIFWVPKSLRLAIAFFSR